VLPEKRRMLCRGREWDGYPSGTVEIEWYNVGSDAERDAASAGCQSRDVYRLKAKGAEPVMPRWGHASRDLSLLAN
jgi:hypothetical protein